MIVNSTSNLEKLFEKSNLFKLSDIFNIQKGKRLTKGDMIEGDTPFIGSSDSNNGVTAYISSNPIHKGNTLSVTYNGSVAECFYQPDNFWASDDVNILYPKFLMNEYIGLFVSALIRKEKYRFNYGRKWHVERMSDSKIKLPINKEGLPNWQGIEDYMKSLYNIEDKVSSYFLRFSDKRISLNDKEWKNFLYGELFQIQIGKSVDLNKLEESKNGINYVGRTEENNGITAKVLNDGTFKVYDGNCITVPMVGNELKSSYQTEPFCVSQNIAILRLKDFFLNPYVAVFLNTIIRKDRFRFAYGRTLSLDRLAMLKIKFPADKDGNPDWKFMEDYIKSLPYSSNL